MVTGNATFPVTMFFTGKDELSLPLWVTLCPESENGKMMAME